MKLNKIMLVAALAMGTASVGAFAADAAPGTGMPERPGAGSTGIVNFHGAIVDAPCSINPESNGQTVQLGTIGNGSLKNNGMSVPRAFTIKLEQCDDATKTSVTTAFDGKQDADAPGNLDLGMKGASIVLLDEDSKTVIKVGDTTGVNQKLFKGNNDLNFFAAVKGNGKEDETHPIELGEFNAAVNFALTYQ